MLNALLDESDGTGDGNQYGIDEQHDGIDEHAGYEQHDGIDEQHDGIDEHDGDEQYGNVIWGPDEVYEQGSRRYPDLEWSLDQLKDMSQCDLKLHFQKLKYGRFQGIGWYSNQKGDWKFRGSKKPGYDATARR
jgi:hypothetical protein